MHVSGASYKICSTVNPRRIVVSAAQEYATPLGNIVVDQEFIAAHRTVDVGGRKLSFETMSRKTDEDEHSLEMHLPYIGEWFGLVDVNGFGCMKSRLRGFSQVP